MATKMGSETMGSTEKSRMTLFKDDRSEDMGAILFAALVIAIVMFLTAKKPEPAPAAPAEATAPAAAPAAPGAAPAAPAEPAKK
jgi:hypothetical protein